MRATSVPSASRTSVSTTTTERPTRSGRATASTWPSRTARRKLVLDEIVAVPFAPSGRLRNAHVPATLSARPMIAPPCSTPPAVQSSGAQASRARTSSAVPPTSSAPSALPNGIAACHASRSESSSAATSGEDTRPPRDHGTLGQEVDQQDDQDDEDDR